jgi:hypothetical protein
MHYLSAILTIQDKIPCRAAGLNDTLPEKRGLSVQDVNKKAETKPDN